MKKIKAFASQNEQEKELDRFLDVLIDIIIDSFIASRQKNPSISDKFKLYERTNSNQI